MDSLKEAFSRVKNDIDSIRLEIDSLKRIIEEKNASISEVLNTMEVLNLKLEQPPSIIPADTLTN
jgi:hypothetical protein